MNQIPAKNRNYFLINSFPTIDRISEPYTWNELCGVFETVTKDVSFDRRVQTIIGVCNRFKKKL